MIYIVNKVVLKYKYGWYVDKNFTYRPFRIKKDAVDMIKYDMSISKEKDGYNTRVRDDGCYEMTFKDNIKVLYKITKIEI